MTNDYVDKVINHYIEIEYTGKKVAKEISSISQIWVKEICILLEEARPFVTKSSMSLFMKKANESIQSYINRLKTIILQYLESGAISETQWLSDLYAELDFNDKLKIPSASFLWTLPYTVIFSTGIYIGNLYRNLIADINTRITSEYAFGTEREAIVESFERILQRRIKSLERESVTIYEGSMRNVMRLTAPKNMQVQYVSVLDHSTCNTCASYSGIVYTSIEEAPMVPQHENCRCFLMPVDEWTKV